MKIEITVSWANGSVDSGSISRTVSIPTDRPADQRAEFRIAGAMSRTRGIDEMVNELQNFLDLCVSKDGTLDWSKYEPLKKGEHNEMAKT